MADYRVRFIGDLGNLAQFNSTIRNSLASNNRVLQSANSGVVSRALGGIPILPQGSRRPGFSTRNVQTELDQYNNALVQSGQVFRQFIQGYRTELGALGGVRAVPIFGEAYHTDFRKAVANLSTYAQAISTLAPVDSKIANLQKTAAQRLARVENAGLQLTGLVQKDISPDEQALIAGGRSAGGKGIGAYARVQRVLGPQELATLGFTDATSLYGGWDEDKVDPKTRLQPLFQRLDREKTAIKTELQKNIKEIENDPVIRSLVQNAYYSATNPEGYIGQNGAYALSNPAVRKDLIKKTGLGLGAPYGTQQFLQNAEQQGFQVSGYSKDLERGLTNVTGELKTGQIKDFNGELIKSSGVMTQFSYALDQNGKIVQTWGRGLSGARGFLSQTSRDLIKVIEWTVATTAVFGALGLAIGSLSTVNQLNSDLQRFAITARLSNSDLDTMFKGLSRVAYQTATPLDELVKAADDMALATRRANQSTTEWYASILELANAVGILTNISGLDTVKATDLLVASMKQLNLSTKDLVPLLSQITAAAGGQANSITDIATALGSLSEAATEAGVTTTQQIAAIQVISLATNKSADETATAFKNLFGAINADISVKKLKEFGISVRDAEGNLRPFLDIYKDISDAIDKGIIPQGRITEVLRAISGGRTGRQADAAALIANINKVFEVQRVAVSASNEALVANAQILTTNKSKVTQLQVAFQTAVYEKFNQTIQDLTGTLTQFGTILASVFGALPQPIISAITQLTALFLAAKLLSKIGTSLGLSGMFKGLTESLNGTKVAAAGTAAAMKELGAAESTQLPLFGPPIPITSTQKFYANPTNKLYAESLGVPRGPTLSEREAQFSGAYSPGRSPTGQFTTPLFLPPEESPYTASLTEAQKLSTNAGRTLRESLRDNPISNFLLGNPNNRRFGTLGLEKETEGIFKSLLNKIGTRTLVSAALGGVLGAATSSGQSGLGTAASVAQFAGFGALATANPIGAVIGASLLVGSAALQQLAQKEEDVKKKAFDLQQSLYNLTEQWKIDQAGVDSARTTYDEIKTAIDDTNNSLKSAKNGTSEYAKLQETLGDLQGKLSASTVDLTLALDSQNSTMSSMLDIVKQLNALGGPTGKSYAGFLENLQVGNLTPQQLTQLRSILSQQIFAGSGQPVIPSNLPIGFDPNKLNYQKSTSDKFQIDAAGTGRYQEYTATEFLVDKNRQDSLFRDLSNLAGFPVNGKYVDPFAQGANPVPFGNDEAVAAFRSAADAYKQTLSPNDQADFQIKILDPFEKHVREFGSYITQVNSSVLGAQQLLKVSEILGQVSGPEAQNAEQRVGSASTLAGYLNTANVQNNPDLQKQITTLISSLITPKSLGRDQVGGQDYAGPILNTAPVGADTARQIADAALAAEGLDAIPNGLAKGAAEAEILNKKFGFTVDKLHELGFTAEETGGIITSAIADANTETDKWANGALKSVSDKLLELQARSQGGEFKTAGGKTQYNFLRSQYLQEADSINKVKTAMEKLNTVTGGDSVAAAHELNKALAVLKINGLQGLPDDLNAISAAFFNWMGVLNLSSKNMARAAALIVAVLMLLAKATAAANAIANGVTTRHLRTSGPDLPKSVQLSGYERQIQDLLKQLQALGGTGSGTHIPGTGGGGTTTKSGTSLDVSTLFLSDEQRKLFTDPTAIVKQAYQDALKLQAQIPGEKKRDKNDVVTVFDGLQRIFKERGVSEELMRQALDRLTGQMQKANEKADTVRRIRVGSGDFSAIANVPLNAATGVSVGDTNNITVSLNLSGVLTPAQMEQLANMIAASIARRL